MQQSAKNLVWIDLEMTGLNPATDTILEIATIITDDQLNVLARGPELVIHQPEEILAAMDEWVTKQHGFTGLTEEVRQSRMSMHEAEQQTLEFIKQHCLSETSPLCGNTVWMDKIFLRHYMPKLEAFFHYRVLDVTAVKLLAQYWYPDLSEFEKKDTHRALEDIGESIKELGYYREHIFK